MLTLVSLSMKPPITLPYRPEMPLWEYLRDVIAPAAGFEVEDGKTVRDQVIANGKMFNFQNKNTLLKDLVEDGGKLYHRLALGPSSGTMTGNACPDGGNADGCPICLEPHFNFSTGCLHRFHAICLENAVLSNGYRCPTCMTPFTEHDQGQIHFEAKFPVPNAGGKRT